MMLYPLHCLNNGAAVFQPDITHFLQKTDTNTGLFRSAVQHVDQVCAVKKEIPPLGLVKF